MFLGVDPKHRSDYIQEMQTAFNNSTAASAAYEGDHLGGYVNVVIKKVEAALLLSTSSRAAKSAQQTSPVSTH